MPVVLSKIQELSLSLLRQTLFTLILNIVCVMQDFFYVPLIRVDSRPESCDVTKQLSDAYVVEKFSYILDWPRATAKAYPIKMPEDGYSLCHACCFYLCGVPDVKKQFEEALISTLIKNKDFKSQLYRRWHYQFTKNGDGDNLSKQVEWDKIVGVPNSSAHVGRRRYNLSYFHAFVMANICRRAVIVVTDCNSENNSFPSSIFLPLIFLSEEVVKCPIYLFFVIEKKCFVPLVFGTTSYESEVDSILVPTMDSSFNHFKVPFLFDNENTSETLNKYLFMSSIGHTTSVGLKEIPAAKVPSRSLAKCLYNPGPDPSGLLKECYKAAENGGTADEAGACWVHILSLYRKLNLQDDSSAEQHSSIVPRSDDLEETQEENTYPEPAQNLAPKHQSTDQQSRTRLSKTLDAADSASRDSGISSGGESSSGSSATRHKFTSPKLAVTEEQGELSDEDSTNFVSSSNQQFHSSAAKVASNSKVIRLQDSTSTSDSASRDSGIGSVAESSSGSSATRHKFASPKLAVTEEQGESSDEASSNFVSSSNQQFHSSAAKVATNSEVREPTNLLTKSAASACGGVTSVRVLDADHDTTFSKGPSTAESPLVVTARTSGLESDNGSSAGVGIHELQLSHPSTPFQTAERHFSQNYREDYDSDPVRQYATTSQAAPLRGETFRLSNTERNATPGFETINDGEIFIHALKELNDNTIFYLSVVRPRDDSGSRSSLEETVLCELVKNGDHAWFLNITGRPDLQTTYKRTNQDTISMRLEAADSQFVALHVTTPSNVVINEKGRGRAWDYALHNMLNVDEFEDGTQINPHSDPRKCRIAGCMNLGSPLTANFCQRCYSSLPPAAHKATNVGATSKCKSTHCDNASDPDCRGYCFRCYNMPGL